MLSYRISLFRALPIEKLDLMKLASMTKKSAREIVLYSSFDLGRAHAVGTRFTELSAQSFN